MRITGVESTDLFTGSAGRPLQVVRVTVAATEAREAGVTATLRVTGAGAATPVPFDIALGEPGQDRSGEVGVAVTSSPGIDLPVTVSCEAPHARVTADAMITVAEPGWTMWMVSHFHYDPVWWTTQGQFTEARLVLPDEDGELPDTRTAFDLVRLHLEKARRDQDYKFVLAEIDYLKPHFDAFPQDRAFLRELLRDGRAELVGGTYNEPNTNLTGAETTIRNAVYGTGFQRGVLGGQVGSAWMLDAFGFDPGFPGLMASAGLTSSSWARGPFHQWGPPINERMQFPTEFEWLSPDGNGLLTAYMADHYGAGWTLHTAGDLDGALTEAYGQFRSLAPVAATPNVLLPVGSDHVIPARWVTDVAREWSARYVWPRFVTALPREFFAAVRAASQAEPKRYWIMPQTRDMNPVYTGKDVSYADTKQAARAGETAVGEGERLATLAWLAGAPYPAESLDKAWRQLVYGAHHDAITGTEADQVYLDLLAGWREAWQRGDEARRDAIAYLTGASLAGEPAGQAAGESAGQAAGEAGAAPEPGHDELTVTVANGLARERSGMATVTVTVSRPGTDWLAVYDPAAAAVVPALAEGVRRHADGSLAGVTLTFRAAGVPALGFRRYRLRPVTAGASAGPDGGPDGGDGERGHGWRDIGGFTISNGAFTVTAEESRGGALTSVFDKRAGREVLRGPGNDLVLQEEYEQHPRWGEGPWHLSPKGPGVASCAAAAGVSVRAQRSPVGSRLVASYSLGDLSVTAETLLWDEAERVEFRTHVSGSIGSNRLLRVRFPADLPGGLPVYQTATAVIGRPFGVPETDVAQHWWTLDNPAHHWFGVGSVARVTLAAEDAEDAEDAEVPVALGVAEVVTPDVIGNGRQPLIRDLLTWLARSGVTATCSRACAPRYGSIDLDSNLPDFRIALGGPSDNSFTAKLLDACDPAVATRLAKLVADAGAARLWVPAARPRAASFTAGADLRGARDLPALIVATADPAELGKAIADLHSDLMCHTLRAEGAAGAAEGAAGRLSRALPPGDAPLADGAVAVFNRGTPGCAVTPDGTLWMSLFRACSGWPSGVWIDGDRRTVPDGSSFAWQHWSHTFSYALASAGGAADWREAGFNAAAEEFNHDLIAAASARAAVPDPATGNGSPLRIAGAQGVTLSALKPYGNPLAAGRPGTPSGRLVTVRLRETDGRAAQVRLRSAAGIDAAWHTGLLEETLGEPLNVEAGTAYVSLQPFETVTLAVRLGARSADGPGQGTAAGAAGNVGAPRTPEPVQPVHTRYWLHGKGPAPAGNLPAAVHFTPTRVTLRPPVSGEDSLGDISGMSGISGGVNEAAAAERLGLTVACGPAGASGTVELVVPHGLAAELIGGPGSPRYELPPNGFASWDVAIRALPTAKNGRCFIAARITDALGQVLEDTALVTVGEAGGPDPDLAPEELFFRMQSDIMALAGEADLEVLTPSLALAPGEAGELAVAVTSRLTSPLHGEVQLISPIGSWRRTTPWTQAVEAAPGERATARFAVTVPATAEPGWQSWLLVKLMYFGRVRYSKAIPFTVV